jgi:hypothetical protein
MFLALKQNVIALLWGGGDPQELQTIWVEKRKTEIAKQSFV